MFQHKRDEAPLTFKPPFALEEIVKIEEVDYNGYVYDIEVEEDHSFITNNIIAHNCICVLVPVHEQPEEFVQRLKRWKDNPSSEPNIENWYQEVYKGGKTTAATAAIQKPAFLQVEKHDKNYDDSNDVKQIEKDLGLIPESHKELLKQHGVVIRTGYDKSRYDRKNKVIQVGKNPEPGEITHEIGHAIETIYDLYRDQKFLKVLKIGIPVFEIGFNHLIKAEGYKEQVIILRHPEVKKFVSDYQARVYPSDIDGEGWVRFTEKGPVFNVKCLGEYLAEGYRVYCMNPELLKKKDPDLYTFIERLVSHGPE